MADQQSSMFGSCVFSTDILKVTLGTGSFLDVVTKHPHASMNGLYPLVGYKVNNEVQYVAEGSCNDTGSLIEWAKSAGLIQSAEGSSSWRLAD